MLVHHELRMLAKCDNAKIAKNIAKNAHKTSHLRNFSCPSLSERSIDPSSFHPDTAVLSFRGCPSKKASYRTQHGAFWGCSGLAITLDSVAVLAMPIAVEQLSSPISARTNHSRCVNQTLTGAHGFGSKNALLHELSCGAWPRARSVSCF